MSNHPVWAAGTWRGNSGLQSHVSDQGRNPHGQGLATHGHVEARGSPDQLEENQRPFRANARAFVPGLGVAGGYKEVTIANEHHDDRRSPFYPSDGQISPFIPPDTPSLPPTPNRNAHDPEERYAYSGHLDSGVRDIQQTSRSSPLNNIYIPSANLAQRSPSLPTNAFNIKDINDDFVVSHLRGPSDPECAVALTDMV